MVNLAKKASEENGINYLNSVFCNIEKNLLSDLERESRETTHDGTMGGNCEKHWINLFRKYLPVRYGVAEAFVVDSNGKVSDQIDIVIYDPLYTPALFGHGRTQYLPREAVYAVFEVKQSVTKQHLKYASDKAASVQGLHCTSAKIINAGKESPPRKIFPVITGLIAQTANWETGLESKSFANNLPKEELNHIDFVITAESGFYDGRKSLESSIVDTGDGTLMKALFRLLQALQHIGTVPAIDWSIYENILCNQELVDEI